MDTKHFKSKIAPFFWVNHEDLFSVCLSTGEYKQELFETREEEGFEGNGYDWCALAKAFLKDTSSELCHWLHFVEGMRNADGQTGAVILLVKSDWARCPV